MSKYPSQADLLSSIQQAAVSLSRITLDDELIKSLSKIDYDIHSILDYAYCKLIREDKEIIES